MRKILFGLVMMVAILSTVSGCKSAGAGSSGAAPAAGAPGCGCGH